VALLDPSVVRLLLPVAKVPFGRSVELKVIVPFARRVPLRAPLIPVLFNPTVAFITSLAFTVTGVMDQGALTNFPNRDRGVSVMSGNGNLFTTMPETQD
jgi:hypothetical protein